MTAFAWPYRYELLDGLRGVAALLVVMHHLGLVTFGHFAVMAFFVISGYCITASAESCRQRGVGFLAFMSRRVRRIYPPYLCALLFFAATRAVKTASGGHNDLARSALEWLQNITLTQWLSLLAHPLPMSTQNPTLFVAAFWSLNYEEQFYLVIALCLVLATRRNIPMVLPVLVLTGVGLAFNVRHPGNWDCGLFIEYWVHLAMGALLFYVLCKYPNRAVRRLFVASLLTIGIVLALCLAPWGPERLETQRVFVELLVVVSLTLSLLLLRPLSGILAGSRLWQPLAALGTISYSLYLIHQFNLTLLSGVAHWLLPRSSPLLLMSLTELSLHVALAALFWRLCERPFTGNRAPRAPAPIPAAAT
jgi:peptidoglycan/LPS O-acetylase OafA/YrhL